VQSAAAFLASVEIRSLDPFARFGPAETAGFFVWRYAVVVGANHPTAVLDDGIGESAAFPES
jgi:hypothetical protein